MPQNSPPTSNKDSLLHDLNCKTSDLKKKFLQQKNQIYQQFLTNNNPYHFFESLTQHVESIIAKLWQQIFGHNLEETCLIAIGGFGRTELYPYSDIDLALIIEAPLSENQNNDLSSFITELWDIGLSPSITVGTIDELITTAKDDITVETSFLEGRYLLGKKSLAQHLLNQLDLTRNLVGFIEGKINELETRHTKFKGAAKQLEPDIKNSLGGLRDIHTIIWIMKAEGLDVTPRLSRANILTSEEINLILTSHRNLAQIRIHLHELAGKNENFLFFNYHIDLARLMQCDYPENPQKNVEQLMQLFYRSTKINFRLEKILIPMLQRRIYMPFPRIVAKLTNNYYQVNNNIAAHDLSVFTKDPTQILVIVKYYQQNRNITGFAPKTLRAWWQAVQTIDCNFAKNKKNQQLFLDFFRYERGIYEVLQMLNLYGFLERYIPDFGRIVGLLQNDLFHIYPVDDHILMVIYYLKRLENENFSYEVPVAYKLIRDYPKKYLLYLAAFFHDIGKGLQGKHETIGAEITSNFCQQNDLPPEETELVTWLIQNHLLLSITAQKKDIADFQVVMEFCQQVPTIDKLISLYLLTTADIRGTNPAIWNNWKQNLIFQLFSAALKVLDDKNGFEIHHVLQKTNILHRLIAENPQNAKLIYNFSDTMVNAFFDNQTLDEIEWEMQAVCQNNNQNFFDIKYLDKTTFKCIVYLTDLDHQLYTLCLLFAHLYLNIIQARAYLTEDNRVLYKFIVTSPEKYIAKDINRALIELKQKLTLLINAELKDEQLTIPEVILTRRSLHSHIIPMVSVTQENYQGNEQEFFLISIKTINRNALLANIVGLFGKYQIRIISANINTLGERVEDSFLVRSAFLIADRNRNKFKNDLLELCSL